MLGVLLLAASGCHAISDPLLDAPQPDIINPNDVQNADGAEAARVGAIGRLKTMTAGDESTWIMGGLFADEWKSSDTFQQRDETDQRLVDPTNAQITTAFRFIHRARLSSMLAIGLLRKYKPAPASNVGMMFFVKGFAELQSAQDFCDAQIFSDATAEPIQYGSPITVAQAFQLASASFDSALANAGTDAGSALVNNLAKLGKARAQIGLKNYAGAATLVATVPTNFVFNETYLQVSGDNGIWALNNSVKRYTVQDSIERNGALAGTAIPNALPFVSAKDPRVPTSRPTTRGFDGVTLFDAQQIWPTRETAVALLSGVEARLDEAEAALKAGDVATYLQKLNDLRAATGANSGGVAGLTPLADPGTQTAREDLLFRERAFWNFGRGSRLFDLRRRIRDYGRATTSFPGSGAPFHKGGNYGTQLSLPIPQAELNNANAQSCDATKP